MSAQALPREYRLRTRRRDIAASVIVMGTVVVLLPFYTPESVPGWVDGLVTVLVAGLFLWMILSALARATIVDLTGIQVRGLVRRKRLAWEEIQEIQAVFNPMAAIHHTGPEKITYAYGRDAKPVLLAYVDSAHVDLEHEIPLLVAAWKELRGRRWTSDTSVGARIIQRDLIKGAVAGGLAWTALSIPLAVVVALLPVFVDLPRWTEDVLTPTTTFGIGLPAIFVVTSLFHYRRDLTLMGTRS